MPARQIQASSLLSSFYLPNSLEVTLSQVSCGFLVPIFNSTGFDLIIPFLTQWQVLTFSCLLSFHLYFPQIISSIFLTTLLLTALFVTHSPQILFALGSQLLAHGPSPVCQKFPTVLWNSFISQDVFIKEEFIYFSVI